MKPDVRCPYCYAFTIDIPAAKAQSLYERLRDRLVLVASWGCYLPSRRYGREVKFPHAAWPLHYWGGPGHSPLIVEFSGKPGTHPTFDQFCKVYGLRPVED